MEHVPALVTWESRTILTFASDLRHVSTFLQHNGMKVLCCFCYANLATRWIIQDQLHVGNTLLDDCITSETLCLRDCLSYLACSSNARAGARGHIRRGDAVRVMECILLHVLAGPMVCCMFPCMAAQQTAMLDMRDANPTIIRPPFDPTKVTS
ncbi:g3895 [Coccomyxa elongata]